MVELPFHFCGRTWTLGSRPLVMGILNVTPDSFSDGGQFAAPTAAVQHGLAMAAAGADLLDVGGESTRPGAAAVTAAEEEARVLPVIRELVRQTHVPVSIDTSKASVARAAVDAGAVIVNDVSGLQRDSGMLGVLRETQAGCVLMHMRGTPETMQQFTEYGDLLAEICDFFRKTLARAADAGVAPERFVLDPGIGFSKTAEQNLVLLANLSRIRSLGRPVLAGPSRKSFIGRLLSDRPPAERAWGTAGAVACSVFCGADIVRVHEVREMADVAIVAAAVRRHIPRAYPCADGN